MNKNSILIKATLWALALSVNHALAQESTNLGSTESNSPHKAKYSRPAALLNSHCILDDSKNIRQTDKSYGNLTAYKYLLAARANLVMKRNFEAEDNFMKASITLSKVHHEPAFANLVWIEYAEFLETQNRTSEAVAIRKMVKNTTFKEPPRFNFSHCYRPT